VAGVAVIGMTAWGAGMFGGSPGPALNLTGATRLAVGETGRIQASVTDAEGAPMAASITFGSSDPSVVSIVDPMTGAVSGVAEGSAWIVAQSDGVRDSILVTVQGDETTVAQGGGEPETGDAGRPAGPTTGPPAGASDPPQGTRTAEDEPPAPRTGGEQPTEVVSRPSATPSWAAALSGDEARDRLRDMLLRLEGASSSALAGIRDSTAVLYDIESLPAATRGLAAYLHADALQGLGAGEDQWCLWARRADGLNSTRATQNLLEGCGG
jgi:hypothetical protein